jgi:hypothetical protein
VLAADPEAGLEALLAMNPPQKPELVMPLMQGCMKCCYLLAVCCDCVDLLCFLVALIASEGAADPEAGLERCWQ